MPKVSPSGNARTPKPAPIPTPAPEPKNDPVVPAPEVKAAPPPEVAAPTLPQLAALEAQLRQQADELKALKAAPKGQTVDDLKGVAQKDMGKAIEALGLTYDQVVEHFFKNPGDPTDAKFKTLEDKIASLGAERDAEKTAAIEAQSKQMDQARQQLAWDVKQRLEKDSDGAFAGVKALELDGEVWNRMQQAFIKDGRVPSMDSVLAEIETEIEGHLTALAKLPKYSTKLAEILKVAAPAPTTPKDDPIPTLTHRSSGLTSGEGRTGPLTAKQIRQRMIDTIESGRKVS